MTRNHNWYVLTGGPSAGKTTLLAELATLGHITVPEAARWVIDQGLARGLTVEDIRKDERQFQIDVLKRKIAVEAGQDENVVTFFDRGMHDTAAYLSAFEFKLESWVKKAINGSTYHKVFVLDPLPVFTRDYSRNEDEPTINRLNELLFDVYNQSGIETLRVPVLPLAQRLKYILDRVKDKQKQEAKV